MRKAWIYKRKNIKGYWVGWEQMVSEYIEAKKIQGVTQGTLYEYVLSLRNFERLEGKCDYKQFTQNVIDDFILKRSPEVKRATLNKDLRNLKTFVYWCRKKQVFEW